MMLFLTTVKNLEIISDFPAAKLTIALLGLGPNPSSTSEYDGLSLAIFLSF